MPTTRGPKPIELKGATEPADHAGAGYRIRLLASRVGSARPDAEIGFIDIAGDTPPVAGGSSVVEDLIVAYVTEMLTLKRKLPAPWLRLRELLATPVEDLELSKAGLARLKKKHLARVGEALLADAPVPGPVVEVAREAASALLGKLKRELEKVFEQAADADTHGMWRPGDDLVAQREAILSYGGTRPYAADEVMQLVGVTTRQALAEQRKRGRLFALPVGERNLLYPHWQFAGTSGELIPGFSDVLEQAPPGDPWGVADILTRPQEVFGGETPIEVLARGKEPDVKRKLLALLRRAYE